MLCLGSIEAAEPRATNQEAGERDKQKKATARNAGAPQGKIYVATETGVYNAGKNNQNKGAVATGNTRTTGRQSAAQTGTDAQGRLLVGTDGGVWRGGNNPPNKTGVVVSDTNATGRQAGAHSGNRGKLIVAVDDTKKASPEGTTHSSGKKTKKGETNEARKNKSMTMKGQKILQN